MTLSRYPDWQSRLQAAVAARQREPFAWGSQDCCLFVCDCIEAMTGHDPAADVRGYHTAREAAELVQRLGGMRAIGASRFGAEIAPALAQVGDVGLVEQDGRESLALCGGSHWVAVGEGGLVALPMNAALAAWRAI